jgi:hypothetical protein
MGTTCPAGPAGLPLAYCHSQRNSGLAGLEASARLVLIQDFAQAPEMDGELGGG